MDYNYNLVFQFKMDYNVRVLHILLLLDMFIVNGCFLIFKVWFFNF